MSFGARLTAARKRKGLTQEGLGKGLGTDGKDASKAVVYGWEKDQHFPKVDQLVLICDRLGCTSDHLLFGKADAATWTPEVLAVATEIESLPKAERSRVLRLVRQLIELAQESASKETALLQTEEPDEAHRDLHQRHTKSA